MITLNSITLRRGDKILLEEVSLSFYNGQKIGIVGKNGSGKTSLFSMLMGEIDSSGGDLNIQSAATIVTIEQEMPESESAVIDYVIDADIKLRQYETTLKKAQENKDSEKIAQLYEEILMIDGLTAKSRAAKILKGLGFLDEDMEKPVNALSGGWRMRLNIARALFVPSDILFLDEPTNHLDLDTVIWLEKWLQRYPGLLLLISHDREFLDQITTHIAHIENKKIKIYSGNYSGFEKARAAFLALQQKQFEKQQKKIDHIESYIRRFRVKATKARQAQSRIKALDKMQKIMPAHIDSSFDFEFKEPSHLANPLITFEKVYFAYDMAPVLMDSNFQLNAGDRLGLLGRNGAGKSTFIKLLAGDLAPKEGIILKNNRLKIGYFAQHTLSFLDKNSSALLQLQKIAANTSELNLRKFLGGFDFVGDMALMPVEYFSGGEKARLALALIVWQAPNVLLLDEPTNHLDMDMRHALTLALQNYDGAVIVVSHDRFFLNQVVDEYYLVSNKQVKKFNGDLTDYHTWLTKKQSISADTDIETLRETEKQIKLLAAERKKELSFQKQEVKALEKKLIVLQKDIDRLDSQLIELSTHAIQNSQEIKKNQIERADAMKQYQAYETLWMNKAEFLERKEELK